MVAVRPLSARTLLCAVSGEVDLSTAPRLRDRLLGQIGVAGSDLVVDLSEVGFLGAAGLTVLVEARAAAAASGVGLHVVARTRPVLRPMAVTGLDVVFDVFPRVDDVPSLGRLQLPPPAEVERRCFRPGR
ncbi:STAS domain-containing protein [Actinosynnema sp. NPDC091369]